MRTRNVIATLILLLLLITVAMLRRWQEAPRREALNRTPEKLLFYATAECRMRCMGLSKTSVQNLLQTGVILLNKSRRNRHPCPLFAIQGKINEQQVQVFVEQCRNGTFVVWCAPVNKILDCDCPDNFAPKKD